MAFYIGPDFHVSSDIFVDLELHNEQLKGFMLDLIFMYLQINRINEFRGTLSASKGFFTLVLIFMYLQIYRFPELEFH